MLTALAAALAATLLVVLGARAVMAHISCTDHPVTANVAVAPELAPAAQLLAALFNRQHRMVGGRCAQVAVQPQSPGAVAAAIAQGAPGTLGAGSAPAAPSTPGSTQGSGSPRSAGSAQGRPGAGPPVDAWIPDSQLWADVAQSTSAGAKRLRATGIVVARTPLVIAMPRPAAARTPAFGTWVTWRFLFPQNLNGPPSALGLNVQFPDPTRNGAGLATLVQFRRMLGYGRMGRFGLASFVFNVQVVAPTGARGPLAALESLARPGGPPTGSVPVTVTSEQAVVQFDRAHPSQPLAVRYPDQGTTDLTYPYLTATADPLTLAAAREFGTVLRSGYATSLVRYEGFRSGNGAATAWPASYGLNRHSPRLLPTPAPASVVAALRAWQRLTLGLRLLALNDISSSMAVHVTPKGPTLEQLLGHAAALGMARFPDSTQMGLWVFASHLPGGQPYRAVVPLGPLPGPFGLVSRRQAIADLAASSRTVPAGAALYGSLLAAYQQMTSTYQPQYVNGVVVLTAGVEKAPGDISAAALEQDLRKLYNPRKPINITLIMIGGASDFGRLQQIVAATKGQVYDITRPSQISTVFYQATGRLICRPHCPK